jgi:drug/metabolite transporter (DMT)-like permease
MPFRSAPSFRTLVLTAITMIFFAGNSLLARRALRDGAIDGGSYTAVRILAGAAALAFVATLQREGSGSIRKHGSLRAALLLFCYAITFSFAYLSLSTGMGALLLFAAVQITMLGAGIAHGERPPRSEWLGLALAFGGLVYLVSPGLTAPSPAGVSLMALSGVAWGGYSLAAKGVTSPVAATAGNFVRASPLAVGTLAVIWATGRAHLSWSGAGLAVASGAISSGLGYAIWYSALEGLGTSRGAIVQLTVPVLAAIAGVVLLGEPLTWRLALASCAILGGVALALAGRAAAVVRASQGNEGYWRMGR